MIAWYGHERRRRCHPCESVAFHAFMPLRNLTMMIDQLLVIVIA